MSLVSDDPACWSWPLPAVLTREQEIERLVMDSIDLCERIGTRDHLLTAGAARLMTRNWPTYLLNSWHDERCALCGIRPGHLVDDHDHRTGLVRGRLCRGCNISEGACSFGEAAAYQLYRERPPAVILGVRAYYVGRGWEAGWWLNAASAQRLTGNPNWQPDLTDNRSLIREI